MSGCEEQQNYLAFFIWTLSSDCVAQALEYGADACKMQGVLEL